jgi:hypothetical protein
VFDAEIFGVICADYERALKEAADLRVTWQEQDEHKIQIQSLLLSTTAWRFH